MLAETRQWTFTETFTANILQRMFIGVCTSRGVAVGTIVGFAAQFALNVLVEEENHFVNLGNPLNGTIAMIIDRYTTSYYLCDVITNLLQNLQITSITF